MPPNQVKIVMPPTMRPGIRKNKTSTTTAVTVDTSLASVATMESPLRNSVVTHHNQMRPLHCVAQQYAWGRLGSSSTVALMKDAQVGKELEEAAAQTQQEDAQDSSTTEDLFEIDEDTPYAELWLGTHPNGMSQLTVSKKDDNNNIRSSLRHSLLDYIQTDSSLHCGGDDFSDLSFLLKVLSVRKVLSIQAHPDKKLAEQLHAERPHIYKDPNHKPEMAIAMSDKVRAMCGFRPLTEIAQHLNDYPEFQKVIGADATREIQELNDSPEAVRATLQHMFKRYLEAPATVITENVDDMVSRLQQMDKHNDLQKLILQLEQQFPGDCGIFAPLIFNIVELEHGQGLFIGANEPHAYISGEILECMACSDNVVRAGLTPKLKDVPTLVNMLTYKTCLPDIHSGTVIDECTTRYQPPVEDFCVEIVSVPANTEYVMKEVDSPSVLLTMEGDACLQQEDVSRLDVSFGSAAFCSANTHCTIVAGDYGVRLTRAFTNVYFHEDWQ